METVVNSTWQKSKLLIKGFIIGVLVLLLMIPAYFVQNLVKEREERQKEAVAEVSGKWAGRQTITGPVVVLPYWQILADTTKRNIPVKGYAYFLPDRLEANARVTPQEKHRGIYKVMLYNSNTRLEGNFSGISPALLNISPENIIWNEAYVQMHISESKGLNSELSLKWNDSILTLSPQSGEESAGSLGSPLKLTSADDLKNIRFSTEMNLNGSEQLLFTPIGKSTRVNIKSTWSHPSFTGNILPQTTVINDSGFTATWTSLSHTRKFPQQWKDRAFRFEDEYQSPSSALPQSAFGMDLFIPVNGYQKTLRSVKYAILCILLTFTAFFLIETTNGKSVHPVQYALIGFALILFYTLLLSFSEYTGFNIAYGIASLATIGLIGWFVKGLLRSGRLSLLLSFVLVLLYSYVFTILQLQDYALLMGSIGLFFTLAVVMYFSRRIQW
jgi:inner membrane protein